MRSFIDLHMHSMSSDGSDPAENLPRIVRSLGIRTFALTDHDTIAGVCKVEKALEVEPALARELTFFPGVEFSCKTPAGKCHILGFGYDRGNGVFKDLLQKMARMRREKTEARLAYLQEGCGFVFDQEELEEIRAMESPGKPHIADRMVRHGYARDRQEAIDRYIGHAPGGESRVEAEVAVSAILAAGGLPVWAHPLGGEGERRLGAAAFEAQLETLLAYGLKGLECYYSRYRMDEVRFLLEHARQKELYISGGSDYHGTVKDIPLGTLNAEGVEVEEEQLTIRKVLLG